MNFMMMVMKISIVLQFRKRRILHIEYSLNIWHNPNLHSQLRFCKLQELSSVGLL